MSFSFLKKRGLRLSVYSVVLPAFIQLFYVRYVSYNVDEAIFGKFVLLVAFVSLVGSFLFSMPMAALTRYIGSTNNKEKFINEFATMLLPLNLLGVLIIYLNTWWKNISFETFFFVSLYFVLMNRYSLNKTIIFQLVKRGDFLNISILEKMARFFFPVLFFYFYSSEESLLYGLVCGYLLLVLYASIKAGTHKQQFVFSYRKAKLYFLYAYPLLLINLSVWVVSMSDRFFIDNHMGEENVGVYSILAHVAGFFSIITSIFVVYVQPIVFRDFAIDKKDAVQGYHQYIKLSVPVFVVLYLFYFLTPKEVLAWVIDESVVNDEKYLQLLNFLVIASILVAYVTILTNIFALHNSWYVLSLFWAIAAITNIGGNLLIEQYGIYAASLSKVASYSVLLILMLYWIKRKNMFASRDYDDS